MEPQGMCLQENVPILFPRGGIRRGSIWQHTDGAKCIYAAILVDGEYVFLALEPEWHVASREGNLIYQGMSPIEPF